MTQRVSQEIKPFYSGNTQLSKLPCNTLVHIFSYLTVCGLPSAPLTCKYWSLVISDEFKKRYPMPVKVRNSKALENAKKMQAEGAYYHGCIYALHIRKLFLQIIERPISPCSMEPFYKSNKELLDQIDVDCQKANCTLNQLPLESEVKNIFRVALRRALNESNTVIHLKISCKCLPLFDEIEQSEILKNLFEKITKWQYAGFPITSQRLKVFAYTLQEKLKSTQEKELFNQMLKNLD